MLPSARILENGARDAARDVVEAHARACIDAGIVFYGINAEVMPGQWEFQVGYRGFDNEACDALRIADDVWVARYLLHRVSENFGVRASFENPEVEFFDLTPDELEEGDRDHSTKQVITMTSRIGLHPIFADLRVWEKVMQLHLVERQIERRSETDHAIEQQAARKEERLRLKEEQKAEREAREREEATSREACARAIHYLSVLDKQCPVFYDAAGILRAQCPPYYYAVEGERSYIDDDERQELVRYYLKRVFECREAGRY